MKKELPDPFIVVWVRHIENKNACLAWLNWDKEWQSINSIGEVEDFNDCYNYDLDDKPITHWMPLSPPPNFSKQETEKS